MHHLQETVESLELGWHQRAAGMELGNVEAPSRLWTAKVIGLSIRSARGSRATDRHDDTADGISSPRLYKMGNGKGPGHLSKEHRPDNLIEHNPGDQPKWAKPAPRNWACNPSPAAPPDFCLNF